MKLTREQILTLQGCYAVNSPQYKLCDMALSTLPAPATLPLSEGPSTQMVYPSPATEREADADEAEGVAEPGPLKWQCDKGHRYTSPSIPCPVCNPPAPVEGELRQALKNVVDGNDLAHTRGEDMHDWPTSPFRRQAIAALSTLPRPASQPDRVERWKDALTTKPSSVGDSRKIVWLRDQDGMEWWGVRYWNEQEGAWWISGTNGGSAESATVLYWMDGPLAPAALSTLDPVPTAGGVEALREAWPDVLTILQEYARKNPIWSDLEHGKQDPCGVHALLARLSTLPAPVEGALLDVEVSTRIQNECHTGDEEQDHVHADRIMSKAIGALTEKAFDEVERWYA